MIDTITQNILNLSENEQDRLFAMLTQNAHILIKLIPSSTLLAYVISGTPEDDTEVTRAYTAWKLKNQ